MSYANSNQSAELYKGLFETTLERARQNSVSHGFRFKNPLYSVGATTVDLCLKLFPRADFRENKGGIKLTVKLDRRGKTPCFAAESNAREHQCKQVRSVPFAADDVVVFDRGYAGYGCFAALTGQKVWFMTRLKKDAKFKRVKKNECTGQNMVSDYEIIIPGYSAEKYLKKIIARNPDTGKKITLLTSNLRWAASTVSAVYKDRWQTELFLRG